MWRCVDGVQRCGMEPRNSSHLKTGTYLIIPRYLDHSFINVNHVDTCYQEISMA